MDRLTRTLVCGLLAWQIVSYGTTLAREPVAPAAQPVGALANDAQLADVMFVDAEHGWAVGDRGVIWHTSDGGQEWKQQRTGVDCRINSVFFLDEKIGWAAGGATQPYTHASTGVVLRTRDGGEHWTAESRSALPSIARVGFFDPAHGWALGQPSAYFPSGVFWSDDGGRSWTALPATESRGWLTGDFIDPQNGALGGRASSLATVRRRAVETRPSDFGLRAMRRMKLVEPAAGWLVGDGGLVLATRDLGRSWQTPEEDIPPAIRNHFDFSALAVRGSHVWAAGTPGTRVLHSADGGHSWELQDTRQPLPIYGLSFVDERRGWAAGELGRILATSDGGKTWRVQRAGGERGALVGFFSRPADIPLELLARLAADEGYLSAMEILNREDLEVRSSGAGDAALAAQQASVLAGASAAGSAWRFPLRQAQLKLSAEQLVETWNQANDGQALDKLEAHVVARIRMWRPNVIVTTAAEARDPLSHVLNQVVLRAAERAADPAQYREQLELGLQPWKTQKVFGSLAPGQNGTVNINTAQLAARFGRSFGELAAGARGVLDSEYSSPIANLGFRLLIDNIPQAVGQRDFFSGIALAPGSEARRRYEDIGDANLDSVRREAQLRRNLQAIMALADKDEGRQGRLLADIGQQTRALTPERAVEVLFQLAERYYRRGQWESAAECFDLIVERHADHPLAAAALVWLVQYYASSEAAWRNRIAQQLDVRSVTAAAPDQPAAGRPAAAGRKEVQLASAMSAATDGTRGGGLLKDMRPGGDGRLEKAVNYARRLEQLQPALYAEPPVRFPLAVVQRQQGLPRQSDRFFMSLRHSRPHDAWWACSQAELWLAERKEQAPKELWTCARATMKPRLDGRLDEPLWRAGNVVQLTSPQHDDSEWNAAAMLAYDDEFLYLGVHCQQAAGAAYSASDKPRPRDADLTAYDRVELLIDVDRDFATYYRLTVDSRGWTSESCWQDATWNPDWFVAHGAADGSWTAEAAIPLSELTGERPKSAHAWAVGIQRIVPTVGFQAWTSPASPEVIPQGFGLLLFQ